MADGKKPSKKTHHAAREVSKEEQERRSKVRSMVKIRNAITITSNALDSDVKVIGNMLDLTVTGVGIATSLKLPIGQMVTLTISGRDYDWTIQGRVVWCARLPISGHVLKKDGPIEWRIGLDLSQQDEAQSKIMENIVALYCKK